MTSNSSAPSAARRAGVRRLSRQSWWACAAVGVDMFWPHQACSYSANSSWLATPSRLGVAAGLVTSVGAVGMNTLPNGRLNIGGVKLLGDAFTRRQAGAGPNVGGRSRRCARARGIGVAINTLLQLWRLNLNHLNDIE